MTAARSRRWPIAIIVVLAVIVALGLYIELGGYDVAADARHTAPVRTLLDTVRRRSIAARAAGIALPGDLDSQQRIQAGAGLYGEMCAICHGGPGLEKTELAQGLYPQAPELARASALTPAQQFWIIKHGVKMTAMPAWGRTHPDPLIWDMVAFLQRLPRLSAEQYRALVTSAPEDHDDLMHEASEAHHHNAGEAHH
jgi:mono/diheme cytochrome c family protein